MSKYILIVSAMFAANVHAASPAATQDWVRRYLATNAVTLAQTTTMSRQGAYIIGSCGNEESGVDSVRVEAFDDAALVVSNSVSAVTNGTMFVWDGRGEWINPESFVVNTRTNYMYAGVGSIETNGAIRIPGWFDIVPVLIQPSRSFAITNGMPRVTKTFSLIPSVYAAVPTTAEGWYTPDKNWDTYLDGDVEVALYDAKSKEWQDVVIQVSKTSAGEHYISTGSIVDAFAHVSANIQTALYAAGSALSSIVTLDDAIGWNTAAIKKIGENLNDLVSKNGIEITDNRGNKHTIRFGTSLGAAASGSGSIISATSDEDDSDIVDNQSIEWYEHDQTTTLALKGFHKYQTSGSLWNLHGYDLPIRTAYGLDWVYNPGIDGKSVSTNVSGKLELEGWASANKDSLFTFADVLIGQDDEGESIEEWQKYKLMLRNDQSRIDYLTIGSLADKLATPIDDMSLTTNGVKGAIIPGSISIVGFADASEGQVLSKTKVGDVAGLKWITPAASTAINIVGTDGSSAVATNRIVFASAEDSNVKVTVEDSGSGNVKVTFGVYYK